MKKFKFVLGGLLLLSALSYSADIILKLADNHAEDYPTVLGDKEFARLVEERSNGNIRVDIYPGGQLGSEENTIEQVQFGVIDMVRTSISPLTRYDDKFNVLMLPYLYSSDKHMFKVLDGNIGLEYLNLLKDINLMGLAWFDSGARNFYNSKKPIKTPDDMKELKIRVQESELMMELIKSLGASPTPMSFGEVYGSLQTGVIDGAENNTPSYDSTSHFEVAKFYTLDGHTRIPEMLIINTDKFNSLSPEYQGIIKQSAFDAALKQREFWKARENSSMEKIKNNKNNEIYTLTESDRKAFQDKVKPLYREFAESFLKDIERILNEK